MVEKGYFYTKEHEWVKLDGNIASIGITHHAQEMLGEITFVEMPEIGNEVAKGDDLAVVESSKAASDTFSPVAGKVVDINGDLEEKPEFVNDDCYKAGWICKIEVSGPDAIEGLMDSPAYEEYLKGL